MSTVLKLLNAPIKASHIKFRVMRSVSGANGKITGYIYPYIRAHAIREILNSVIGPENWEVKYEEQPSGAILCTITIRSTDGAVSKSDCGVPRVAMDDKENQIKAGYSDAFKRAARAWGIGDSLASLGEFRVAMYSDPKRSETEQYHMHKEKGQDRRVGYYWEPPKLPSGTIITDADWKKLTDEANESYLESLSVAVPSPDYARQMDARHTEAIEAVVHPQPKPEVIIVKPEHTQTEVDSVMALDNGDEGEPSESNYSEYPAIITDKIESEMILESVIAARNKFKNSSYAKKTLAYNEFTKSHPIPGFKIKEPKDLGDGSWEITCSQADIIKWSREIDSWGK